MDYFFIPTTRTKIAAPNRSAAERKIPVTERIPSKPCSLPLALLLESSSKSPRFARLVHPQRSMIKFGGARPRQREFRPRQQGQQPRNESRRLHITPDAFVIRFPDGDYEYFATQRPVPRVGETIHRWGTDWLVTRVVEDGASIVYVEPAEEQLGETG